MSRPSWLGLSPRVRGNPIGLERARTHYGSIPACTGEPPPSPEGALMVTGLSPRVRGNLRHVRTRADQGGSIPACTGEPSMRCAPIAIMEVYPRVYGGTRPIALFEQSLEGLSPRVRGNRGRGGGRGAGQGSIPACTGEPKPQ